MKWNSFDTRWLLSLFGTAVGAGILFLPMKAGVGGIWPVLVMSVVIFPMVYLSHRALSRFVYQANGDKDFTLAAEEYFGEKRALLVSFLYFFAIFPICLAYCVGITNTFESFIYHQLLPYLTPYLKEQILACYAFNSPKLLPFYRAILAFILVSSFMVVVFLGEKIITQICEKLIYPLCFILIAFSLYLIPHWSFENWGEIPDAKDFAVIILLSLPILIFSFNHSPAISTFTLSVKKEYGGHSLKKADQILFKTSAMLLFFTMFFTLSCVLSLTPLELANAREQNISILSYFANKFDSVFIAFSTPLVAFLAISTSFFGHYFGAKEGAYSIVRKCSKILGKKPKFRLVALISNSLMYIVMLLTAYYDPNILTFIGQISGPIIIVILFLMPIIAFYSIAKLKKFQNKFLDAFVFLSAILTIITVIYTFEI